MKSEYDYIYLIFAIIFITMQGYWCGLGVDKIYPFHICFPMLVFFGTGSIAFLIAFIDSKGD